MLINYRNNETSPQLMVRQKQTLEGVFIVPTLKVDCYSICEAVIKYKDTWVPLTSAPKNDVNDFMSVFVYLERNPSFCQNRAPEYPHAAIEVAVHGQDILQAFTNNLYKKKKVRKKFLWLRSSYVEFP